MPGVINACVVNDMCLLQEQSLSEVEMPGQFLNGDEVQPDRVVWVERISNAVRIVRRHGTSFRRLDFIGSDGHTKRFIVQTGQHWSGTGGEPWVAHSLASCSGFLHC